MLKSPDSRPILLLVEDDPMVRETMIMLLEEDYEIVAVVSVQSALLHLRAQPEPTVDLMLLDCLLPGGPISEILAEADRSVIPVVLISGDPHQAEILDPTRPFVSKPAGRAELLSVLDTARR